MTSLEARERGTYESAWALPSYSDFSPGVEFLPVFLELVGDPRATDPFLKGVGSKGTVIDAGCGNGRASLALKAAAFDVVGLDLVDVRVPEAQDLAFIPCSLWQDLRSHVGPMDWVYCCDVLEHIPTPFTMLTVSRLLEVTKLGAFFSISLVPDNFGVWVGRHLHHTVQTFTDWRDQLRELGHLADARDLGTTGLFFLEPRR